MSDNVLLSICIPSYNRPLELKRLLESVDVSNNNAEEIEIVIREDMAPRRDEVRKVVEEYKKNTCYTVNYIENKENFGYDKNIRQVAKSASGEWVMFMGDDDRFVPGALDQFMVFLRKRHKIGYVLRRYRNHQADGKVEDSRYAQKHVFFKPGQKSIVELFRRSVFISGFTFRKRWFTDYDCDEYDGSLLFQLYILACVCNEHKSCYCDILITESIEGGVPFFGKSESEKDLYDSGSNTFKNSINFMKQVPMLCESIDSKLEINIMDPIMVSYSKYSYGFLHEHRDDGIKVYREYAKELKKLGFAKTYHFYVYYFALLILGKNGCKKSIQIIKKFLGKTPRL